MCVTSRQIKLATKPVVITSYVAGARCAVFPLRVAES